MYKTRVIKPTRIALARGKLHEINPFRVSVALI